MSNQKFLIFVSMTLGFFLLSFAAQATMSAAERYKLAVEQVKVLQARHQQHMQKKLEAQRATARRVAPDLMEVYTRKPATLLNSQSSGRVPASLPAAPRPAPELPSAVQ